MPACRSPIGCICQVWADDAARREKAHVPEAIIFKTKPQIALAQIRAALAAGVAPGVVLMDASYGTNSALRASIGALALTSDLLISDGCDWSGVIAKLFAKSMRPTRKAG